MKKIVFFDIDGTLIDTKRNFPESAVESIRKLQENGVHVAIATGRPHCAILEILERFNIDSFVTNNGNYCVHDGEVVYAAPLTVEELRWIDEFSRKNDIPFTSIGSDKMCSSRLDKSLVDAFTEANIEPPVVDPTYCLNNNVYSTSITCKTEQFNKLVSEVEDRFAVHIWHQNNFELSIKGNSKATGVEELVKSLGYRLEDTYAFGDGNNDIEMLQAVGTGVAMGNADDTVKSAADFVTKHVDEDGIEFGLKKLGLI